MGERRHGNLTIDGNAAGTGKSGTYVVLDRQWSDGDRVSFTLPASLRVTRYRGEDSVAGKTRYSIEYGPIHLAAVGAADIDLALDKGSAPESLGDHLEPVAGSPLHFAVRGSPDTKLMPYYQISNETFTCYPTISVRLNAGLIGAGSSPNFISLVRAKQTKLAEE